MTCRRAILLTLLCALTVTYCSGCRVILQLPTQPAPRLRAFNAQPLKPEEWYADLFEIAQDCTKNHSRSFADIEWLVVGAHAMGDITGLTSGHSVYLDERAVMDREIVIHEEAHFLTPNWTAHPGPDSERFDAMLADCIGSLER